MSFIQAGSFLSLGDNFHVGQYPKGWKTPRRIQLNHSHVHDSMCFALGHPCSCLLSDPRTFYTPAGAGWGDGRRMRFSGLSPKWDEQFCELEQPPKPGPPS